MTTSVYLLGEPGVGRSSVMGELLTPWAVAPAVVLRGDLIGEPFGDRDRIRGLHLDARLVRTGAYGRTGIRADGTNAAGQPMGYDVIVGTTKGECLQRLWDMARLIEVGRRSLTT